MKKTVHIHVKDHPDISGSFPWEPPSAPPDGTPYKIRENKFPMNPVQIVPSGPENQETLEGAFTINVGDPYGEVTFAGAFVLKGGEGQGMVSWGAKGGEDPWTSGVTIPVEEPDARAKGYAS